MAKATKNATAKNATNNAQPPAAPPALPMAMIPKLAAPRQSTDPNAPPRVKWMKRADVAALSPEQRKQYEEGRAKWIAYARSKRPSDVTRMIQRVTRIAKNVGRLAGVLDPGSHQEALTKEAVEKLNELARAVSLLPPEWCSQRKGGSANASKSVTEGAKVTLDSSKMKPKGLEVLRAMIDTSGELVVSKIIGDKAVVVDGDGGKAVVAKRCLLLAK